MKVLLIEDDEGDAFLLQALLSESKGNSIELSHVTSLQAGLAELAQASPDLILLDLSLPDAHGLESFKQLGPKTQTIPIVVLSGLDDEKVAIQAVQEGAQDYLVKGSVNGDLLIRAMQYAIERKRAEIALRKARDELEIRVEERTLELSKTNVTLRQQIIEREKAEADLRAYAKRLKMLHEIDRAIIEAQSPQAIAQIVLSYIHRLLPYQRASILTFDYETKTALILAVQGPKETKLRADTRLPLDALNSGDVYEKLQAGQIHLVENIAHRPQPTLTDLILQGEGIHSYINIPLRVPEGLIGVLNLSYDKISAWEQMQLEFVQQVANQISVAIRQARLYEQVQHHAAQLEQHVEAIQQARASERKQRQLAEALREVGIAMNTTLNLETLLDCLLDQIKRVVPYDAANIMLVEDDYIRVVRMRGYEQFGVELSRELTSIPWNIATTTNLRHMVETGQALIISDTRASSEWKSLKITRYLHSWAGAPIKVQDQIVALISLDKTEPGFYQAEHVECLAAFAGQASIAFENARLYEQAQQEITDRIQAEAALTNERTLLARRVAERTSDLSTANAKLAEAVHLNNELLTTTKCQLRGFLDTITEQVETLQERVDDSLTTQQQKALDIIKQHSAHFVSTFNERYNISLEGNDHQVQNHYTPQSNKALNANFDQVHSVELTILVAEDNEDNIDMLTSYLRAKGHRILIARDGAEAIELSLKERPNLIFMDVQMPNVDGLEAIRHLRRIEFQDVSNIPIIAVTGLAMYGDRERCLEAGADDYLSKPLSLKKVIKMIEQYTK